MKENCIDCILRTDTDVTNEQLFFMTRYLPYRVVKSMGESTCCFFEKTIEKMCGVIVYLDIIGFTKIVDSYMNTGRDVADLTNMLSDYYSVVIETIREFGGSVFQFAGDSILICFDKLKDETDENNFKRAFACMTLILELSDNYNSISNKFVNFALRPKIGIGQGEFFQIFLGDSEHSMSPALTGTAVLQAIKMEEACTTQEVVISYPAWQIACKIGLENYFVDQDGFFHLTSIPENFSSSVERPEYVDVEEWFKNPRFYNRIYSFISPIIFNRIKNNVHGFDGEYRSVTCCMVRFDGVFTRAVSEESIVEGYEYLNRVYKEIQDVSNRFGGYCGKPDLSDKGIVFPVFFGMPVAIENKERMALLFANKLVKKIKSYKNKISVNVGISTGIVYSGEFGANMRKDFTIVGNAINFAARLMMNASNHGSFFVFIDEMTKLKTENICETQSMPGILLKGFSEMRTVYKFTTLKKESKNIHKIKLLGRNKELAELAFLYKKCREGGIYCAPIIGDAGQGKSYLAEEFIGGAERHYGDITVLKSYSYPYEDNTPFFSWRKIVKRSAKITDDMEAEVLFLHVSQLFSRLLPKEKNWVSYFLMMLGYKFAENPYTAKLDDATKRKKVCEIAYTFISNFAEEHNLIIVLEDIQWADIVSMQMLKYLVSQKNEKSIFVITLSREEEAVKQFFELNKIKMFHVGRIDNDSAEHLAEILLNFADSDKQLIEKIVKMANRNPYFIEVIVESLVESGEIKKDENGYYYAPNKIDEIKMPYTIQNFILARLNSFPFEAQIICKNASVIGRTFTVPMLQVLIPETISEEVVEQSLTDLEKGGLIICDNAKRTLFTFKEATFRDVIYKTIIESTRKNLNKEILNYLDEKYKDDISQVIDKMIYYATESKDEELIEKYTKLANEINCNA